MSSNPPDPDFSARRQFFRRLLLSGMDAAEHAGRRMGGVISQAGSAPTPIPLPLAPRYLRPPGALRQPLLAQTCDQCGKCVEACPANCIRLDTSDSHVADGLPYIVARESPCVVCDDLSCMKACPTGALRLVEQPADIYMGVAVMDHQTCLRGPDGHRPGSGKGEDCRICVKECPEGEAALGIDEAGHVEVRPGCIGCGVCERACPTEPASIVIDPVDWIADR